MKTKVASAVFGIAAMWSLLSLTPVLFMLEAIGKNDAEPVTHPGFCFGFLCVGLAWGAAFAAIAWNPVRLRPMMIPAVLGKSGYGLAIYLLLRQGRTSAPDLVFGAADLLLGGLLGLAYATTPSAAPREA